MAHSTMEAHEYVRHLDRAGQVADSPSDKKQKAATTLFRDEIPETELCQTNSCACLQGLRTGCRHVTAQILPQMCHASRASRPGLAVGVLRVLCNGMCTAQRFHMEGEEQRCRVGCQDEPDSLSHYIECPLPHNFFTTVWRHAVVRPRRDHLFHDLITQTSARMTLLPTSSQEAFSLES